MAKISERIALLVVTSLIKDDVRTLAYLPHLTIRSTREQPKVRKGYLCKTQERPHFLSPVLLQETQKQCKMIFTVRICQDAVHLKPPATSSSRAGA